MVQPSHVFKVATDQFPDPESYSIIYSALGLNQAETPYRNRYIAPKGGEILLQCYQLADIGMLYFRPSDQMTTFFLVTEAGANWIGEALDAEDSLFMRSIAAMPSDPNSPYEVWRAAVRSAHLQGLETVPPFPLKRLSEPVLGYSPSTAHMK